MTVRPCGPARLASLLVALFVASCGEADTGSRLRVERDDAGAPARVAATWTYRSTEVDVDLTLTTDYADSGCVTTALLWVNEAAASPDTHRLPRTECSTLALTEDGDIVLYDSPTGHDWSREALRVDAERRSIELGPWSADSEGAVTYRFTLSSRPCGDCDCPSLRRRAGTEERVLELGRRCE